MENIDRRGLGLLYCLFCITALPGGYVGVKRMYASRRSLFLITCCESCGKNPPPLSEGEYVPYVPYKEMPRLHTKWMMLPWEDCPFERRGLRELAQGQEDFVKSQLLAPRKEEK